MNRNKLRNLFLAAALLGTSAQSFAGVLISITVAPPPLKVYAQPACPADGYIWTPGYWAYGPAGYHWVNGTWVLAPHPGYLFTPGYWEFTTRGYIWTPGHWGLTVGYYGGVNYGFGYSGFGFYGGHWDGGHFFYNRVYSNVDERRIRHFYREEARDREHGRFDGRDHRREDHDRGHGREHREEQHHEHAEHGGDRHVHTARVGEKHTHGRG